jgi:hypothetical protein
VAPKHRASRTGRGSSKAHLREHCSALQCIAWEGTVLYCTSACREASFQKKRAGEDSEGIERWSMYGQRYGERDISRGLR